MVMVMVIVMKNKNKIFINKMESINSNPRGRRAIYKDEEERKAANRRRVKKHRAKVKSNSTSRETSPRCNSDNEITYGSKFDSLSMSGSEEEIDYEDNKFNIIMNRMNVYEKNQNHILNNQNKILNNQEMMNKRMDIYEQKQNQILSNQEKIDKKLDVIDQRLERFIRKYNDTVEDICKKVDVKLTT